MPITELVIGAFRPEVAKEGLATIRSSVPKYFNGLSGLLLQRVGIILKHNGKDISGEHRSILGIEWDEPQSFHNFYPASPEFGDFVGTIKPFLGGKPNPQLFQPGPTYSRSNLSFESGVTQIFTGQLASKKDEVSSAWDNFVEALKKEDPDVKEWSGWGIEEAEGLWVGILGQKSIENLESVATKNSVTQAVKSLKELGELEEFVVRFGE